MSKPWFSRKRIGFGFRPSNAAGWLVTVIGVSGVIIAAHLFRAGVIHTVLDFSIALAVILACFFAIFVTHSERE